MTRFLAAFAATLPVRYWPGLERRGLAVAEAAGASAAVTALTAAVVGARAFLAYVDAAATAADHAVVRIAVTQIKGASGPEVTSSAAQVVSVAAALAFLVTPIGALTTYLAGSASLRLFGWYLDAPFGDPLLTLGDAAWRQCRRALGRVYDGVRQRSAFGPDVPDRVVDAAALDLPGAEMVIVASRPKDGWSPGLMLVSSDGCYLLGTPLQRRIDGRARILYPLVKKRDASIVRRSTPYDVRAVARQG